MIFSKSNYNLILRHPVEPPQGARRIWLKMNTAEEKALIRRQALALRESLAEAELRERSARITAALSASALWRKAGVIFLYASLPGEAGTWELARAAWDAGKTVCLPALDRREKGRMDFYKCGSAAELKKGPLGILEPERGLAMEKPDLVIVPGLAFGLDGWRIGYGGGFYDRYFSRADPDRGPSLGLAFNFQITDSLPHDQFDWRLDGLCREEGIIWRKI